MKKNVAGILFLSLMLSQLSFGQVAKKIVVEHFTNSFCSICGSRNPGFYNNLSNNSGVLHLAVHPSAPYSSCQLYQQNSTDNDARTNYYGIYGGTPRLVINGDVISGGANYSSNSIFTPYQSLSAPASIRIVQQNFGLDSIQSTVVLKTEGAHTLGNLSLFVALAEDTVFYSGGNGETKHHDVFRKSLTSSSGMSLNLPATIGDSLVYTFTSSINSIWDESRIFTLAILQETSSKDLVQAEASKPSESINMVGVNEHNLPLEVTVFPNPTNNSLVLDIKEDGLSFIRIISFEGKVVLEEKTSDSNVFLDLSELKNAIYFLNVTNGKGSYFQKIVKL